MRASPATAVSSGSGRRAALFEQKTALLRAYLYRQASARSCGILLVLPVPATFHSSTPEATFCPALVQFVGALCLGIVAATYAIADDFRTSHWLVAAMACGAMGDLFTLAALAVHAGRGGQCFALLSLLSAATGTICMVQAMLSVAITLLTALCIAATAGLVWAFKTSRGLRPL